MSKKIIYISLFAVLYLIVAFSSFYHACLFFGLANNTWMSIILAFASKKDRSRVMPWVLMTMFTLVQVIGNIFSSYKYILLNSVSDLKYFKEPIFIWTDLPDDMTTVIVTYIIGAILPITALLLTSMITNYLEDEKENNKEKQIEETEIGKINNEIGPKEPIILNSEEDFDKVYKEETEEKPIEETEEKPIEEKVEENKEKPEKTSHFINLK